MGAIFKGPSLPETDPLRPPTDRETLEPLTLEANDAAKRRQIIEGRRRGAGSLILDPSIGTLPELTL